MPISKKSIRTFVLAFCLLMAACFAPFVHTFTNDFVWDDPVLIIDNQHIRDYGNIPLFFLPRYWNELHPFPGSYRPIREISFTVEYGLWKSNPAGYRVTNLLLHAINVALVFYLAFIISEKRPGEEKVLIGGRNFFIHPAFLTSLLFAAHPIHNESINLIKNRSDLFAFLFFLLSFLFFIKHLDAVARKAKVLLCAGAWFCFIAAVLSKEMALSLPGLLILYAFCFSVKSDRRKVLVWTLPYLAIILGYFWFTNHWFTYSFLRPFEAVVAGAILPVTLEQHVLAVIKTIGIYFKMLIVPFPLTVEHVFMLPESVLEPSVLLSLAVLPPGYLGLAWLYRHSRILFFGVGWILLTLLPAANIVYLVSRPIAEQRLYIPSFGFCLFLGYAMTRLGRLLTRRWAPSRAATATGLLVGFIVCLYSIITVCRNFDWRNEVVFFSSALASNPDSVRIHYNLGNALIRANQYEEAVKHFQHALRFHPNYPEAHNNLGVACYKAGKFEEAIHHYQKALSLNPDDTLFQFNLGLAFYKAGRYQEAMHCLRNVLKHNYKDIKANILMGDVLGEMSCPEEAASYYLTTLRLQPECLDVYYKLGNVLIKQGDAKGAVRIYSEALKYHPEDARIHYELASALAVNNQIEEAASHFEKVLRIQPSYPQVNYKLGNIYLTMGQTEQALTFYSKNAEENPHDISTYNNMGVALMKQGNIDKAMTLFHKALEINPDDIDACYNLGVALMNMQDYQRALALFSKVLNITPDHEPARREYQSCLRTIGRKSDVPDGDENHKR